MYLIASGVSAEDQAEERQKKMGTSTKAGQRIFKLVWILIRGDSEKFCTLISFVSAGSQPKGNRVVT
jgi:hypothetical protein